MVQWHHSVRARQPLNSVARLCLATALACFGVALIGAVVNLFVESWFRSLGMAIVGLFYFALFLANLPPRGIGAIGAAELLTPDSAPHRALPSGESLVAEESDEERPRQRA